MIIKIKITGDEFDSVILKMKRVKLGKSPVTEDKIKHLRHIQIVEIQQFKS